MLSSDQIAALEGHLIGALSANSITIAKVKRFHGGASREVYGLDCIVDGALRGLIVRRDPVDSLIKTERGVEFAAYRSMEGSTVPVPRALSLVEDSALIGAPFFVMERIENGVAAGGMDVNAYGAHRASIGAQFFTHLGAIHAVAPQTAPLARTVEVPSPDQCWSREVDHWEAVIDRDAREPEPIARAAIRWLRRNPPPPAQRLAIVHGDYRNGNVLHDDKGNIIAVLDWEMAHIGDPLEDLAWALDPLWNLQDDTRAAGLIAHSQAIAHWEQASGLTFNAGAFLWWEMFATFKGLAIWISSARAYSEGANIDPILAYAGHHPKLLAHVTLTERLAKLAEAL